MKILHEINLICMNKMSIDVDGWSDGKINSVFRINSMIKQKNKIKLT